MYTILESRPEVTAEETGVKKMIRCDDPLDWPQRHPNPNKESSPIRRCFFLSMPQDAAICVSFILDFFYTFIGILISLSKNALHHVPKKN